MSTFVRKAGLGANSRGYLKLIIEGKRNLTPHTLRRFVDALGLSPKEGLYFENLVYFNQAKTQEDRDYYFERLRCSAQGNETQQFELLNSQYHFCSNWYYVAVRELVGLLDFQEDLGWIVTQLKNKISRRQAQDALNDLEKLGLIRRAENGRLVQSEPLIKYKGGFFNEIIQKFHLQMLDRAKDSLVEDAYEDRAASSVTLSCDQEMLPQIKKRIDEFRDQITLEFGTSSARPDTVIQCNFQIFPLTVMRKSRLSKTPQRSDKA